MNKQHCHLAIWFLVIFVIQGFRMYQPNVPYEIFLKAEQQKYSEITQEKIDEITQRIAKKNKDFPKINRKEFIMFLHSADFDVKKAYTMVVKHYTIRKKWPEIFDPQDNDPILEDLENVKKVISCSILFSDNNLYEPNYRYVYTHFIDFTPTNFDFKMTTRYFFFMIKCLLIEYGTFDGLVVIMNAEGFTLSHVWQFSPLLGMALLDLIQSAPPLRIEKIYIVNSNKYVMKLFSFIKITLKSHFHKKIVFCNEFNPKDVYEVVPREIMPREYTEGKGPSHLDQAKKTYTLMMRFYNKYGPNTVDAPLSNYSTGLEDPNPDPQASTSGKSIATEDEDSISHTLDTKLYIEYGPNTKDAPSSSYSTGLEDPNPDPQASASGKSIATEDEDSIPHTLDIKED